MESVSVYSIDSLQEQMSGHKVWANGKSFQIDHLYPTVAESRWPYENIQGVYLTNENFAWMALWMSICDRNLVRKRQLAYFSPQTEEDSIGSLEVYSNLSKESFVTERGYLYTFDPNRYTPYVRTIDLTDIPKAEKVDALLARGFEQQEVERRGKKLPAIVDSADEASLVLVDNWQVVMTNAPKVYPEKEIIIESPAIQELMGRIAVTSTEIGEDYIKYV